MFHALTRLGWIMSIPMTAPRNRFPPKTRAAEMATSAGRKVNAVFDTVSRNWNHAEPLKAGMALPRNSTRPIIRPEATMAGRIGTNTSPRDFSIFFQIGILEAAAALTSSLVAADAPVTERNSSYTLLTVPVPMMSWSCPLDSNSPWTPSTSSSFSVWTLSLSAMTRRSRVAQCAADTTFSPPPMRAAISSAHFL